MPPERQTNPFENRQADDGAESPDDQPADNASHERPTLEDYVVAPQTNPAERFDFSEPTQQQAPAEFYEPPGRQTENPDTPLSENQAPRNIESAELDEAEKPQSEQTPGQLAWGKLREALEDYYSIDSERRQLEGRILYGHPKTTELRNARRRLDRAEAAARVAPEKTYGAIERVANNLPEMQDTREYLDLVETESEINSGQITKLISETARLDSGAKDIELIKSLRNKIESLEVADEDEILSLLPNSINSDLSRADIAKQLSQAIESRIWCLAEKERKTREMSVTKEAAMGQISEQPEIVELRQREEELRLGVQKARKNHDSLRRSVMRESDDWVEIDARLTAAGQSVIQAQAEIDQLAGVVRLPGEPVDPFEWKSPLSLEQINSPQEHYHGNKAA